MTNHTPHKPNTPESNHSSQQSPRGVYNPITLNDTQNDREPSWLDDFESPIVRLFVALLFATIFGIALYRPDLGPLTIIVVAGCLLFRLEPWQRKLAAAPLAIAAIRLCLLLPAYVSDWTSHLNPFTGQLTPTPGGEFGIPWLPAFLSVCLFYLPRKNSITFRIVVVESLGLILSSLLPAGGFLSVVAIFHFTLFFAIAVGLLLDLKPELRDLFSNSMPNAAPIKVHIPTPPPPRPTV